MANTGVLDAGSAQWGRLSKSVAGSANVTLTQTEYENRILEFTGALTGNINVYVPVTDGREWVCLNSTTGDFTLTVIGATGTGVLLKRLTETVVRCDGTDIKKSSGSLASSGVDIATVADANTSPAGLYLHRINVAAGTTGNVDTVLVYKSRVIDAWLVKTNGAGGGAGTIQVLNSGSAITDAMSIDVADTTVVRAGQINDANHEISAGGTLRITRTRTASTDETCTVYVLVALVA